MEEIILERDGDVPLHFNGVNIGSATSYADHKDRWFEIDIWKTDTGKYVVSGVGVSTVEGESDRVWAVVCNHPSEVVTALYRRNAEGQMYIPKTSQWALESAIESDPAIAAVYVEKL